MKRVRVLFVCALVGCGGKLDDSAQDPRYDSELSEVDAADSGSEDTAEASIDASSCEVGAACTTPSGAPSVCAADGVTCACAERVDDGRCAAAYPGSICVAGACVIGDCHDDSDCPSSAPTCGMSAPYRCGACDEDEDCAAHPSKHVCAVGSHACVTAACTTSSSGKSATCPANPADVCCGPALGGPGTCAAGDCCNDKDCGTGAICTRTGGATDGAGSCHTCAAVTAGTYYVDPRNGHDALGTGGESSGRCAFRTLTHAFSVIYSAALPSAKVVITGGTSDPVGLDLSETYPLTVTENTAVSATGNLIVQVPPAKIGFYMSSGSSLEGFTMEGLHAAHTAIYLYSTGELSIRNLTIQNFAQEGILFQGGSVHLTIGEGTTVTGNGTPAEPHSGLLVDGGGAWVTIDNAAGATVSFSGNTEAGIRLGHDARLTIRGTRGTKPDEGTIVLLGNGEAGIVVDENSLPAYGASIDGLVVHGTTAGSGFVFGGGSKVKLRNSSSLGNSGSGVRVQKGADIPSIPSSAATRTNITGIDLGDAAGGHNVLQAEASSGKPNSGAGICLALSDITPAAVLTARGNTFGAVDCASGGAIVRASSCDSYSDVSVQGTSNVIDVASCTIP